MAINRHDFDTTTLQSNMTNDHDVESEYGNDSLFQGNNIASSGLISLFHQGLSRRPRYGIAELLLSSTNILADIENELLLIRDELYHRIAMYVLQEGLQRDRVMISDDKIISKSSETLDHRRATISSGYKLPKPHQLTKESLSRPNETASMDSIDIHKGLVSGTQPLTGPANKLGNNSETYKPITLATALLVVEHLGIKSAAVFKRYRTALLIQRLRKALSVKNMSHIIEILQEVRILKNSECFDSLAITEVDNIFVYVSNLNIRKSIYRVFCRKSGDSLVMMKYSLLRILRQYSSSTTRSMDTAPDKPMASMNMASSYGSNGMEMLSSTPTIHSRKLFQLSEACIEFVDALGRLAIHRVYKCRKHLEEVWNELDLEYYIDEYEDGFKYLQTFIQEILSHYSEFNQEEKDDGSFASGRLIDPSSLSLTWDKTAIDSSSSAPNYNILRSSGSFGAIRKSLTPRQNSLDNKSEDVPEMNLDLQTQCVQLIEKYDYLELFVVLIQSIEVRELIDMIERYESDVSAIIACLGRGSWGLHFHR